MDNLIFKHKVPIQIRFNDVDGFKHVNNTVYFNYCDYGRLKYLESVSKEQVNLANIALIIASIKMDFLEPIYLSDTIYVKTKVYYLGNKSLKMMQAIEDEVGEIKAICDSVMVAFNGTASIEISDAMKDNIENFEGSKIRLSDNL